VRDLLLGCRGLLEPRGVGSVCGSIFSIYFLSLCYHPFGTLGACACYVFWMGYLVLFCRA